MNEFKREVGVLIVTELLDAPDSQISEVVRARVREVNVGLAARSAAELYDWCAEIAKLPLTEISSFVRELCNVERHYTRPADPVLTA